MKQLLISVCAVLLSASLSAQAADPPPADAVARKADAPAKKLAIRQKKTEAASADSPLVEAAKKGSLAGRKKNAAKSVVIDDAYLRANKGSLGGRVSEVHSYVPLPKVPPSNQQNDGRSAKVIAQAQAAVKAADQKRLDSLRLEQARLAAEMEDPYEGDSNHAEETAKRLKEIESQIQQMNQPDRRP